ncbi:inteferon-activable protein 208 isoform X2 [Phodopus roborovskii]|uniref:Ifi207 protein n=1 Tax=Phodopus roborovskii TaxID=109678 RepID=A0AAU9ZBU9_PHORO|nr:inteferon-activable protein 208 isoform X2 [Phodopus roborovskii]CAH6789533.1 Ifi207 [Phodopus roborovskii]
MSEYKKIVLLKGLEVMDEYQFRTIKSLLRKELNLTKKLQEEFDRIQVADMMEDKFPQDAGLNKLAKMCESIKELEGLAKELKTEKAKVKSKNKGKNKTSVNKEKQEEPGDSQSLSTDHESNMTKPSSQKKRKTPTKTADGKKKKLSQETTQLPEPSGSNIQKDEGCLQTPQKPPPTPSSNKQQKKTDTKKHNTIKTEVSMKKQQLQELPANNISSAANELQTFQVISATVSKSLKTPHAPPETGFTSKMLQGSPAQPCQDFPTSPTNSSMHLDSHVPLTLFSDVQASHVPTATPSRSAWVFHMPSETVSSSLSAPQTSPVSVASSAQNLCPPTAAAFNSVKPPHSTQIVAPSSVQTPRVPSETLKCKAQLIKTSPATAYSNVQVPHALPEPVSRNACTTQVPQRATSSSIPTLNSTTVRAPRNTKAPGPSGIVSVCSLSSLASPATASSSLQASQVLPPTTSKSLAATRVPKPIETSSIQTTQMHPGAAANFIQPLHPLLLTESRSLYTTQVPPGVAASSIKQALPYPEVKASRNVQDPQKPSATTSGSLLAPCASLPGASSSLLDPRVCSATASLVPQATKSSSLFRSPRKGNIPKEPSKEEGYQCGPKEVTVLKVTEPFTYDLIKDKWMFHATVATETEFFRLKVYDKALKNMFIPKKIIAISDYFGHNGFLEIYNTSSVSDVNVNQTMVISNTLKQRANATPKIKDLFSQTKGTYVNGEFMVFKKNEKNNLIYYGIEDDTGTMEVVVYGRLTSIKCEPGNKLQLVCFELSSSEDTWQLKSVLHSYLKVINVRKKVNQP